MQFSQNLLQDNSEKKTNFNSKKLLTEFTTQFSLNESPALGDLSLWTDLKKDLKHGWTHSSE